MTPMLWSKKIPNGTTAAAINPLHKPILDFITAQRDEDFMNAYRTLVEGSVTLGTWQTDSRDVARTLKENGIDNATNALLKLHDEAVRTPPGMAYAAHKATHLTTDELFSHKIDAWLTSHALPATTISSSQRVSLRHYFRLNNSAHAVFSEMMRLGAGFIDSNEAVEVRTAQLANCIKELFPHATDGLIEHRLSEFHNELAQIDAHEMADALFHGHARDWAQAYQDHITRLHTEARLSHDNIAKDSYEFTHYIEEAVCHCLKGGAATQIGKPSASDSKKESQVLSEARASLAAHIGLPKICAIEGTLHQLVNRLAIDPETRQNMRGR